MDIRSGLKKTVLSDTKEIRSCTARERLSVPNIRVNDLACLAHLAQDSSSQYSELQLQTIHHHSMNSSNVTNLRLSRKEMTTAFAGAYSGPVRENKGTPHVKTRRMPRINDLRMNCSARYSLHPLASLRWIVTPINQRNISVHVALCYVIKPLTPGVVRCSSSWLSEVR